MASSDLVIQFALPQRPRKRCEPWTGENLQTLAGRLLPEYGGYSVTVNGEPVGPENWAITIPPEGAEICFVPEFGFLATLLTWAFNLSAAFMSSQVLGPVTWGMIFDTIGYLGASYLVNSLMPAPKTPDMGGSGMAAFGWEPKTTQQEGLPIARHYGTFPAHGNIIAAYTQPSADHRKQEIYALIAFADGPIATNNADNIQLDNQPVANFSGVSCETRRGLLTQTATTHFDQTPLQLRINHKLVFADGAWIYEMPDDDYDDIEIDVRFDLYYQHESGAFGGSGATIKIDIAVVGTNDWTELWNETVTDTATDLYWKKYTVSDEYAVSRGTRYKLRFQKTAPADLDELRSHNLVWIESVREIIDVAFTYPGMVTAEIAGVATEEFSGIMDVSALLEYRIVNTYDGSWSLSSTCDDPAWVLWDLWTLPVISGDGDGTPYAIEEYLGLSTSRLNATDHYALSVYACGLVPDAEDGTEKRFTCNGLLDRESSMWDAAMKVCELARCKPIYNGNIIGLAINQAKSRVGMMSVGNILSGSFEESFPPQLDAAAEIEAIFNNKDRDYDRQTLPYANPNITTTQNKVTMYLWGLVKSTEVVRHIKFRLLQTELRQRTLVVSGDIDTIGFEVGDRIGVEEDVCDFGELGTRGGGRVIGFSGGETNDTVTLDHDVEAFLTDGVAYELCLRLRRNEAPTIKTVLSASGAAVTVSGHYAGIHKPRAWDLWALGKQNLVLKDFTIEAIRQSGRNQRQLTLLEYDSTAYDGDDETPVVAVPSATAARTDRHILTPAAPVVVRRQAPSTALDFPTVDIPLMHNIKWNDDTPFGGYISWSATDGSTPLLFHWKGTVYQITPNNTHKQIVYFDSGVSTTAFLASDSLADALGANKIPVAVNHNGSAVPFVGLSAIHAAIMVDASIVTAKIADLAVTTAKIGNLQVETAKIGENAVTIPTSAYTEAYMGLGLVNEYDAEDLTFTSTGQPVDIHFGYMTYATNGTGTAIITRLYKDEGGGDVEIFDSAQVSGFGAPLHVNMAHPYFFSYRHTPAAGSVTYTFTVEGDIGGDVIQVGCRYIGAIEVKK